MKLEAEAEGKKRSLLAEAEGFRSNGKSSRIESGYRYPI